MSVEKKKFIEVGDIVTVNINNLRVTLIVTGEVVEVPTAALNRWVIVDKSNDFVHYISESVSVVNITEETRKRLDEEDAKARKEAEEQEKPTPINKLNLVDKDGEKLN